MSQAVPSSEDHRAPESARQPSIANVRATFDRMKEAHRTRPPPGYEERMARLGKLSRTVRRRQDDIAGAVRSDFGNRSTHESKISEVLMLLDSIKYVRKNLKGWMKPQSRRVSMSYKPASAKVHFQPLGVVGIISPWNYPFQLALGPMAFALAAGNRVLVKPSEYTPATSDLIREVCADLYEPDVVDVVTGGPEVGEAFSHLPFDHLLYTGSTAVGRLVMQAAAENLTPVTLELGGKSPTIVHESFPTEKAAARIAFGKWFNAGQTCIAPDYVFAHESRVGELVDGIESCAARSYPTLADNPDYTSIVSERHFERLSGLVEDAVSKGATKVEINPAGESLDPRAKKIAPTILIDVDDEMKVMQEEIFGPLLPVMTYRDVGEVVDYVNARPRPLALYYFDYDKERARDLLDRTISGGAAINEVMLHFAVEDAPFGGVGASGIGAYHGREGFETFSHKRTVLYQARLNATGALSPPFGDRIERMLSMLIGR